MPSSHQPNPGIFRPQRVGWTPVSSRYLTSRRISPRHPCRFAISQVLVDEFSVRSSCPTHQIDAKAGLPAIHLNLM